MPTKSFLAPLLALLVASCGLAPTARPASAKEVARASGDAAKFLAHPEIEAKAPGAFSLQPESLPFLQAVDRSVRPQRDALVSAIQAVPALAKAIAHYDTLTWNEQVPVLKQVMALEGKVMGFTLPPLVIQEGPSRIPSYFDFDPAMPGTGKVILYPEAIAQEKNPYASLLLLIHEVRHSAKFQLAHQEGLGGDAGALAKGFKASFGAQRVLYQELGFCDFCSLNAEFEAFQAGNYVVGRLTGWRVETLDMGCLSSQYDAQGKLRVDLLELAHGVGPAGVLAAFNQKEEEHYRELTEGRKR